MSRKAIQRIIVLAILAITGIIATQIYWINNAMNIQEEERQQQIRQNQLNTEDFNDRVHVALTNVAEEILIINNDPAELYKAVEQLRPNYFVVRINDTLHPYLLENLLKREFDKNNIDENYRYGIYDCFTDSIVYRNTISSSENSDEPSLVGQPQIKWDTDGHYFSVTFPDKPGVETSQHKSGMNVWILIAVATIISVGFIAYALIVIMRQKRLSEIKTDFINNMTHELKTPISTISLSSEVLLRPDTKDHPERIERYAKIILDENTRLQNQVDRVLQLARLDKGDVSLKKQLLDMHELIEGCVDSMKLQLKERNGKISVDLNAKKYTIDGDPVHITNILFNLLDNANKYSRNSPEITVETSNSNNGIEISISDKGSGIPKESLGQIFDKFYRVPSGNIHDVKGFGLGLFYVKELVNKHGGTIKAKSEEGDGSTFTIWLPLKTTNE